MKKIIIIALIASFFMDLYSSDKNKPAFPKNFTRSKKRLCFTQRLKSYNSSSSSLDEFPSSEIRSVNPTKKK